MKPGTNPEAIKVRAQSACGCIKEGGICRDIDVNGCKPSATIDCKKAVQEINDIWTGFSISDNICRWSSYFTQMVADSCII